MKIDRALLFALGFFFCLSLWATLLTRDFFRTVENRSMSLAGKSWGQIEMQPNGVNMETMNATA